MAHCVKGTLKSNMAPLKNIKTEENFENLSPNIFSDFEIL